VWRVDDSSNQSWHDGTAVYAGHDVMHIATGGVQRRVLAKNPSRRSRVSVIGESVSGRIDVQCKQHVRVLHGHGRLEQHVSGAWRSGWPNGYVRYDESSDVREQLLAADRTRSGGLSGQSDAVYRCVGVQYKDECVRVCDGHDRYQQRRRHGTNVWDANDVNVHYGSSVVFHFCRRLSMLSEDLGRRVGMHGDVAVSGHVAVYEWNVRVCNRTDVGCHLASGTVVSDGANANVRVESNALQWHVLPDDHGRSGRVHQYHAVSGQFGV